MLTRRRGGPKCIIPEAHAPKAFHTRTHSGTPAGKTEGVVVVLVMGFKSIYSAIVAGSFLLVHHGESDLSTVQRVDLWR